MMAKKATSTAGPPGTRRSAEQTELLRGYYQDWFIGAEQLSDATPFDQLELGQIDELTESFGFVRYRLHIAHNKFTEAVSSSSLGTAFRKLLSKING